MRCLTLIVALTMCAPVFADPIVPLKVHGEDFVDPAGKPVRFWGVNLVALYPDHARADAIAADLASLQVNLVRPHHNLRPSLDWNPKMVSGSLLTYKDTSREFDKDALDRFDYLNAALRKQGIYLAFSANWTRRYLPGDVDVLRTDNAADREAWVAAMKELNGWNWKKAFDVYKMLPCVDERAAMLNEEFVRNLLTHVNPYSNVAYGEDPQILTFEVMNESSTEYAVVCGNHFPEYWEKKLDAMWQSYASAAGVEGGDLYKPANDKIRQVRASFLRQLDQKYYDRIRKVLRDNKTQAAITFSNLWRGDNALALHAGTDFIEGHMYGDPLVAGGIDDWIAPVIKSAVAGKPFIVGELNQAESSAAMLRQSPTRTMLPLSAAAYGSLQNWAGITWFAWTHGDATIGADGWAEVETRGSNLGRMVLDGMQIDHLRTCGLMFRHGYLAKSSQPVTVTIDEPYTAGDYNSLMRGKYNAKPGWQSIHEVRKAIGIVPAAQANADWMTKTPPSPITSDTGQIIKDIDRKQLTVAAPKAEAFSGTLDGKAPAALQKLVVAGEGFATVIAVSADDQDLAASKHLIVSRTALDGAGAETGKTTVRLKLATPASGESWQIHLTRPRDAAKLVADFTGSPELKLMTDKDGYVALPAGDWHECELTLSR